MNETTHDNRPSNCRFRLQDEGKSYPRSSCSACGKTVTTGLGRACSLSASPPPPSVPGVTVKPLEWRRAGWVEAFSQPEGLGLWYSIQPRRPVHGPGEPPFSCLVTWAVPGQQVRDELGLDFQTLEAAKAAAQSHYETILSALSTAVPKTEAVEVTIKSLEWIKHPTANLWRADTIVGLYQVASVVSPATWTLDGLVGASASGDADSEFGAKAACQADFEQRIHSALYAAPPSIAILQEENRVLRSALKPFAKAAKRDVMFQDVATLNGTMASDYLTVGDLRRADAALNQPSASIAEGEGK